jgi:signal transduction histidine kinase
MEQARVFVVSDDRKFVDSIVRSWHGLRYASEFAVAGSGAAGELARGAVVVTDDPAVLPRVAAGVVLAIAIPAGVSGDEAAGEVTGEAAGDEALPEAGSRMRVVWIPRLGGWAEQAAVLTQEILLRLEAQAQLAEANQRLREMERFAAVGRFILEARHGLGNALTGVLGHSELLLMEAGAGLGGEVRGQLETIHAMSLKMHETFHRLSSLETELRVTERQAERQMRRRPSQ